MKESIVAGWTYEFNKTQVTGIFVGLDRLSTLAKINLEKDKYLIISINQDKEAISEHSLAKQNLEKEEIALTNQINQVKESLQLLEKERQELRTDTYNKKLEIQSLEYEKTKVGDYLRQVYSLEFDSSSIDRPQESLSYLNLSKEIIARDYN